MKSTTKAAAIGLGIVAVATLGSLAYAQRGQGYGYGMMHGGHGMGPGMGPGSGPAMGGGRMGGMMGGPADPTAHLESLKARLGIRADQEAAWTAYAKIVTDNAAERRRVHDNVDRDAVHKMTPAERQSFRDSMMKQHDADFAKVKSAAETLLATLDDNQKTRARQTLPGLADAGAAHGRGEGRGHGMRHGMMDGPGGGRWHDRH